MTGAEMVTLLGVILEDEGENQWTSANKVIQLNRAQIRLCMMLHEGYLSRIQYKQSTVTLTNGITSILSAGNALTYDMLGGADSIMMVETNTSLFGRRISVRDLGRQLNTYMAASANEPMYYVFQKYLYLLPSASFSTVNIYYLREPTALADDTTECEVDEHLHELIVDLAASQCFKAEGKTERSELALNRVLTQVQILNSKYLEPTGLGTDEEKKG